MNVLFATSHEQEVNNALGQWAALRIFESGGSFAPPFSTMGVFDNADLIAVIVFHNYSSDHGVIEISGAAETPRWLTRPVLYRMFAFAFITLGCQLVTMRVDPADKRLRRILTAYGFDTITLPRFRGRDKDETLYTLTDDKWIANGFHERMTDGQEKRA